MVACTHIYGSGEHGVSTYTYTHTLTHTCTYRQHKRTCHKIPRIG